MRNLTERQRKFVNAYVTNGQNGTAAAREAGYKGTSPTLRVTASRLLTLANVQRALADLTGKAIKRADRKAVMTLADCLAFNSMVVQSRQGDFITDEGLPDIKAIKAAPAGLVREVEISTTTNEEGQVFSRGKVKLESALAANNRLIEHFERADEGERRDDVFAEALKKLPPEVIAAIARAMLAGPRRVIDVSAKVVP